VDMEPPPETPAHSPGKAGFLLFLSEGSAEA